MLKHRFKFWQFFFIQLLYLCHSIITCMHKSVFVIFFLFNIVVSFAQITTRNGNTVDLNQYSSDSTNFKQEQIINLSGKTSYKDYKVISYRGDTTYIDTTLTQYKDHKFNYIRKDDFELLPFHNQGQTYNKLGYSFSKASLYPSLGVRTKHFNFYEIEDIDYYHVATPTTELMYKTGLEQGQVLDALFTFNTSKRLNFSIAYKGLRSLGKYRTALSSHGNLRFTSNYRTKNDAYSLRAHIVAQDLTNEENGGLTKESVVNFETDNSDFSDRARLATNFNNANNVLRANRYYLAHDYKIWQRKDSLNNTKTYLKVGNILNFEGKHYDYNQSEVYKGFGNSFNSSINDKVLNIAFKTQAYIALKAPIVLGEVKFKTDYYNYKHNYSSIVNIDGQNIPASLKGNTVAVGGEWRTRLKKFNIDADISTILAGNLTGNYLKATASYDQDSLFSFKATFLNNSKSPNFNFLLNQSSYVAYNWKNNLKNEINRSLIFDLKSEKLLNASAEITQINNYVYLGDTISSKFNQPTVQQFDKTINYLKVKVSKDLRFGKFGFDNTLMYQKVASGSSVFRVPEFVTRNSLYFADYLFKGDPLYLHAGVTFNYFTKYYADAYNPILSEFHIQNNKEIGGYPVLDFFVNAQVQRTRLFFKIEHFNSSFGKTNNYFVTPKQPYRDFVIRFGLVWNFFI